MPLLELNAAPSTKDLRWFAGLWWPIMCAVAGISLVRKLHLPQAALGLWVVAGILAVAGLIAPQLIRPVYGALLRLTYPIGFVVSYALLFMVYFFLFAPIGLLVRCFHDPMTRKLDRAAATYWSGYQPDPKERYFRQF
jgi:hypothetical protein